VLVPVAWNVLILGPPGEGRMHLTRSPRRDRRQEEYALSTDQTSAMPRRDRILARRDEVTKEELHALLAGVIGALQPELKSMWTKLVFQENGFVREYGVSDVYCASRLMDQALSRGAALDKLLQRALLVRRVLETGKSGALASTPNALLQRMHLTDPELRPWVQRCPFGFTAFNLFLCLESLELLRVNTWSDQARISTPTEARIHTHQRGFRSWVLTGELVNEVFDGEVVDRPTGFSQYAVACEIYKRSVARNSGKSITCNRTSAARVRAGEDYLLEKGTYHDSTVNVGEYTATLFRVFPQTPTTAFMIGPESGTEYPFENMRDMNPDIIQSYLETLERRL
jgi:hypothetical protein